MSEPENQDSLSVETKKRLMKLRLHQLAAITQLEALRERNRHLDLHGDNIYVASISSVIDNLFCSYEKNLLASPLML